MEAVTCNIDLQTSLSQLLSNILTSGHKSWGNDQAGTPSFPYLYPALIIASLCFTIVLA